MLHDRQMRWGAFFLRVAVGMLFLVYGANKFIQGTGGIFSGYPDRIYIEGRSHHDPSGEYNRTHDWESIDPYMEKYEHELWRKRGGRSKGARHGGMDYLEDYRLIRALRLGVAPDFDVYDAAAWSVITPLSEMSVARGGKPVRFPDFTRGDWAVRPPIQIVED